MALGSSGKFLGKQGPSENEGILQHQREASEKSSRDRSLKAKIAKAKTDLEQKKQELDRLESSRRALRSDIDRTTTDIPKEESATDKTDREIKQHLDSIQEHKDAVNKEMNILRRLKEDAIRYHQKLKELKLNKGTYIRKVNAYDNEKMKLEKEAHSLETEISKLESQLE